MMNELHQQIVHLLYYNYLFHIFFYLKTVY